jgi:hypothetical protein
VPSIPPIDLSKLTLGEVDTLETEVNERLRDLLGANVASIDSIVAQFQQDATPPFVIPKGKIMRILGWIALRRTRPDATWEEAGDLDIEVEAPKAPDLLAESVARVAASGSTSLSPPPLPTYGVDD